MAPSYLKTQGSIGKRYLNECDAVFVLRRDVAGLLPLNYRITLFAFYLTYGFFEEALSMINDDSEIEGYFKNEIADLNDIKHIILDFA